MIFKPFDKIGRWSRGIVITEKLDGTNASVFIVNTVTDPLDGTRAPIARAGECRCGTRSTRANRKASGQLR